MGRRDDHQRYEWYEIERAYVEGLVDEDGHRTWPTLTELAALYLVAHPETVRDHCARGGWVAKRKSFQASLSAELQRAHVAALVEESIALDRIALKVAKDGLELIDQRLADLRTDDLKKVDAEEVRALAGAAKTYYDVGARAVGDIPTSRLELTAANGGVIESATVAAQLSEPDDVRLAKTLEIYERMGLVRIVDGGADGETRTRLSSGEDEIDI